MWMLVFCLFLIDQGHHQHTPLCECDVRCEPYALKMAGLDQLIVTEIMQNPAAVSDTNGEYFEVFNPGSSPVNLNGWTLKDLGSDAHVIAVDVWVPAGGYLVLGRNANTATNGGVQVGYQYSNFSLANSADEVVLLRPDQSVAQDIRYGAGWPTPNGASMELSSLSLDNQVGANWQLATLNLPSGDLGTPGTGPNGVADLVITEIMQNPAAVSDSSGEWFELYNPSGISVSLTGWIIRDNGSDNHTIQGALTIAAGGFLVLGNNGNSTTNGGVNVDYVYSGFNLANADDEIVLVRPDNSIADEVDYGLAGWPSPNGASMMLQAPGLDNQSSSNWSLSTASLPGGDKGSPGFFESGSGGGGGNQAPVVNAGADQTAYWDGSFLTLNLNGAVSDPDGDALTVQWQLVAGDQAFVVIHNGNQATTAVDLGALGLYTFELQASDGSLSTSDTVSINVVERPPSSLYNVYFGNLHAHSSYSDGNKANDPNYNGVAAALRYGRDVANLDYLMIADHNHATAGMAIADYHSGVLETQTVNQESTNFVGIYGAEWGTISTGGHVIYDADTLWGWEAGNYDSFVDKGDYASLFALIASNGSFGELCHPSSSDFNGIFNNPYRADWDQAVSLVAIKSGPAFATSTTYGEPSSSNYSSYYNNLLLKGYHVGPAGDQDTHYPNWGLANEQRTAILAPTLDKAEILAALRAGRTYACEDRNVLVTYLAGFGSTDYTMASVVQVPVGQSVSLDVFVSDPDGEATSNITLYSGRIGGTSVSAYQSGSGSAFSAAFSPVSVGGTDFFYARITQADGQEVWTAPIWIEGVTAGNQAPVADFSVAINGLSTSFSDQSSDADGSIVARNWSFGDGSTSTATNPQHTYTSAGTYSVTLTVTDNLGATDQASQSLQVTAPVASIMITEIMQNPAAVSDSRGEWFELYNPGTSSINLQGWTVRDDGSDSFTISSSLNVPAGGFVVLGRNGNTNQNGGVSVQYVYSGMTLGNGADALVLVRPDGSIAYEVHYDGGPIWPDPNGASMYLTNPNLDNQYGSNWATSTQNLPRGDKGTPGRF
ncbi:MAG: lamin tail domain-containing protein [Acidobacteria bacterium]|nr:lamin tail domain-containing protein [Acidobacteriota bacterium]